MADLLHSVWTSVIVKPLNNRLVVKVGTAVVVLAACKQVYRFLRVSRNNQKKRRKRAKRAADIERIKEKCKFVKTEEVERITSLSLSELRKAIAAGELKPSQVLLAYQAKSLEAHHMTNCIVEYIVEAEVWAEEADRSDGAGKALFGIPVSLKEDVPLKGYDCTLGLAERCEKRSEVDCTLVQQLRLEGAIPFCRTNLPQFKLAYEVSNPIFGETCSPLDPSRGPGGSSGGESALIAAGASVLGIGSDSGGSIRNPCSMTGLCGFKPTSDRHSKFGLDLFAGEQNSSHERVLKDSYGPIGRDVDSVIAAARILLDGAAANAIDPLIAPLPFNDQVFSSSRPLRIGYYVNNGLLTTVPAVQRAVLQAKAHMEAKGHTLIEWLPPDVELMDRVKLDVLWVNACEELFAVLKYDTMDECVNYYLAGRNVPQILRPLYALVLSLKDPRTAENVKARYKRSATQYFQTCATYKHIRRRVMEAWRRERLDAVICPAAAFPALPLKSAELLQTTAPYFMMYNLLNFPAGVVRMTRVTEEDSRRMRGGYPEHDATHRRVKQAVEGSVGLPVGVQVVAPWYEDEMCLRVMREVEAAADFHVSNA